MISVQTILILAAVGSIALNVLAIGLAVPRGALRRFLGNPRASLAMLVAMFIAMPLVAIAVARLFALAAPLPAALFAISLSPMPPLLSRKAIGSGPGFEYAIGIQSIATLVSLVAAPLWIVIVGRVTGLDLPFDASGMAKTLAITVFVPLLIGLGVRSARPEFAARISAPLAKAATIMLLVPALILFAVLAPKLFDATGGGVVIACLAMVVAGLAIGHALGGPDVETRSALAVATAARHPGVAIGLASQFNPAAHGVLVAIILLHLIIAQVAVFGYQRLVLAPAKARRE